MSTSDWFKINSLIQDVVIARANLKQKMSKQTEEDVINKIIIMANEEYNL